MQSRPAPDGNTEERTEIKNVAHLILERIQNLLALDGRHRSATRSLVKLAIEDVLDEDHPRASSPKLYQERCCAVFEHVHERYPECGTSIYGRVACPGVEIADGPTRTG